MKKWNFLQIEKLLYIFIDQDYFTSLICFLCIFLGRLEADCICSLSFHPELKGIILKVLKLS